MRFIRARLKTAANQPSVPVERLEVDEEQLLASIPRNSQDAIVSCLSLHWVNDLPGALSFLLLAPPLRRPFSHTAPRLH